MNKLRGRLFVAMEPKRIFHAQVWGHPRAMTEALREVRKTMAGLDGGPPSDNLLQSALLRFATTQKVANFTELKYVCYGVTVPIGEGRWRLIDREPLFRCLLVLVEQHAAQPKHYRRCYQGLLTGYFGFDKRTASDDGHGNWYRLRDFLGERLSPIVERAARVGVTPDWVQALVIHKNLLTEDPCSRYARDLQLGRSDEFRALCRALDISSTSWVWDKALMAYVRAVCDGDERHFQREMPGVLDLVNGRTEMKLADLLCARATAMTVVRYARCTEKPEHPDLRDTSLHWIGNPWVDRTAWDAHVQHEPARQMIEGWLKRRLIKDFFELLAHDGGADLRRLNYWLKWEPKISDMWFVLGFDASSNRSDAFEDLRKRMVGRRRTLDDPNAQNNAFVMRIGPLLVIEFGVTGNACYAFAAADFKADLDKPLLSIHVLKQRVRATRLSHMHSWEPRFDAELRRLLQSVPGSQGELPTRSATTRAATTSWLAPLQSPNADVRLAWSTEPPARVSPTTRPQGPEETASAGTSLEAASALDFSKIIARCNQRGLDWEDNRSKKGAFWVLMPDRTRYPGFASSLDLQGFRYTPGKGFWIKDRG